MNEDFVPFELAVKLKEKWFNYKCHYNYKNSIIMSHCSEPLNHNADAVTYSAPTISQVLKWLRKKYLIHISTKPYPCEDGIKWMYEIRKFSKYISFVVANTTGFVEEEQAALAGVNYCLDNLI